MNRPAGQEDSISADSAEEFRLPGTAAFFEVFDGSVEPADGLMVSAVGLLGVWVRHYDQRRPGRPMSERLAGLMDLHIWLIDCQIEELLSQAFQRGFRPEPGAREMRYSYGEFVSLLTADLVQCLREQSQPGRVGEDQVLHHIRHWDGFDAMVESVAAGHVRLQTPRSAESGAAEYPS